jgi:hypothetical protein
MAAAVWGRRRRIAGALGFGEREIISTGTLVR